MPRKSPFTIVLTPDERRYLEATARNLTSPYRDVVRARIVLAAAEGMSNEDIADELRTPREVVSKWRKRFHERRRDGLEDAARSGRPARFSPQRRGRGQGTRLSASE